MKKIIVLTATELPVLSCKIEQKEKDGYVPYGFITVITGINPMSDKYTQVMRLCTPATKDCFPAESKEMTSMIVKTFEGVKHALNNIDAYDAEALGCIVDRINSDLSQLELHGS